MRLPARGLLLFLPGVLLGSILTTYLTKPPPARENTVFIYGPAETDHVNASIVSTLCTLFGFNSSQLSDFLTSAAVMQPSLSNLDPELSACKGVTSCAQQAFIRLFLGGFRNSYLPIHPIWTQTRYTPVIDRHQIWRWLGSIVGRGVLKPPSSCMEWGTNYMDLDLKSVCTTQWEFVYRPGPSVIEGSRVYGDGNTLCVGLNMSLDLIINTQVLMYIENPDDALVQMYHCLRPGGHLILTTALFGPANDPRDFYRFTLSGIHYLLTQAGFTVVESLQPGGLDITTGILLGFEDWYFTEAELMADQPYPWIPGNKSTFSYATETLFLAQRPLNT